MIEDMAVLHITEAELARDLHGMLEMVRHGVEIVVEQDARAVAVIKPAQFQGRSIDECIALIKAEGSHATLDDGFADDLEEIIRSRRDPLKPPSWD